MSRQNHLLHLRLSKKRKLSLLDKSAIAAAFLYPMSGIPQVIEVFKGNVSGVSLLAWFSFMVFSFLFLLYGLAYKIKPMIITNVLWFIVESLVVVGILIHSTTN
jgi:uncharacterized protein with PQ loop repeat